MSVTITEKDFCDFLRGLTKDSPQKSSGRRRNQILLTTDLCLQVFVNHFEYRIDQQSCSVECGASDYIWKCFYSYKPGAHHQKIHVFTYSKKQGEVTSDCVRFRLDSLDDRINHLSNEELDELVSNLKYLVEYVKILCPKMPFDSYRQAGETPETPVKTIA